MIVIKALLIIIILISGVILAVTPDIFPMGLYTDKALHLFTFAILSIILTWRYMEQRKKLYAALILVILMGVAIEAVQLFVPDRAAQITDIISNIAGIIYGLITGYLLKTGYKHTINNGYQK